MNGDIRVLCHACANNYRLAGYVLVRVEHQQVKQDCDICGRICGYEYEVLDREVGRIGKGRFNPIK